MEDLFIELYLDRVNNFLTNEGFASYYGLPDLLAVELLKHAEFLHELRVAKYKRELQS